MKLRSDSFLDGATIPAEFAFGKIDAKSHITLSDNRNPHLAWDGVPDGTRSFALVCHDRDVPSRPDDVNQESRDIPADLPRVDFFHWVMIDLPAPLREIAAGAFSHGVTPRGKAGPTIPKSPVAGALHGLNDYTNWFASDHDMSGDYHGYDGPCPPWNDTIVHHYVFSLYALSIDKMELTGKLGGAEVRAALAGKVLAEARITGLYTLNPVLAAAGSA